jgi:riboflavin biosynthesis pyrimidine reductase
VRRLRAVSGNDCGCVESVGAQETEPELDDLDRAYWIEDPGRQSVTAMMVSTADGAAQLDGRSAGLGNSADTALFALLRAHAEVLLVGAGTARTEGYAGDHPSPAMRRLRARRGLTAAPRIALVTNGARLDPRDPLFVDTEVRPLVLTSRAAPQERLAALAGLADVVVAGDTTVDIGRALDVLADRGLRRVSCEGGPTLLAQVIAANRLDELRLTVAPLLTAGAAPRITAGAPVDPRTMRLVHVFRAGDHLFLRYRLDRPAA